MAVELCYQPISSQTDESRALSFKDESINGNIFEIGITTVRLCMLEYFLSEGPDVGWMGANVL